MNLADLQELVVSLAVPGRVARARIPAVNRHVVSGLVDLQTFIPGLKDQNVDRHDGSASYWCGGMEVPRPSGEVIEVYALRGDVPNEDGGITADCQCRVQYDVYGLEFVRARCREYVEAGGRLTDDNGAYVQMLPQDFGFYAVDPNAGTILAYPAAVMPWNLFVRYAGIVQEYDDGDEVFELRRTLIDLLVLWVQAKYEGDLRCWDNAARLMMEYEKARRDEIFRINNELRPQIVRRSPRNPPRNPWGSRPNCSVAYAYA